jgi:hypothetical protein
VGVCGVIKDALVLPAMQRLTRVQSPCCGGSARCVAPPCHRLLRSGAPCSMRSRVRAQGASGDPQGASDSSSESDAGMPMPTEDMKLAALRKQAEERRGAAVGAAGATSSNLFQVR